MSSTRAISGYALRIAHYAFLLLAASLAVAAEPNLLPNPSFETPSEKDPMLPQGWTPHVGGKTACAWATEGALSGKRCLEMSADPTEKWGHAYWTSDPVAVKPCMAYRVIFHFKAKGWGVPCFSLAKVKDWRLFKNDTEGKWLTHDEVVVVPPGVTSTFFSVNNYNRPGKMMWLDDVSLAELPLSESPLTKRLERARANVAALRRNLAPFRLSPEQEEQLLALGKSLDEVAAAYAKLAAGQARAEDFTTMNAGLDAVEKALGGWLLTVWGVEPGDWLRGQSRPAEVARRVELAAAPSGDGKCRQILGIMSLIDEGLPVRVTVAGDRGTRDWAVRLLVTPAHRLPSGEVAWGEVGPLGEVLLPPGTPRFLQLEVAPGKDAKPGLYTFQVRVEGLDRTLEPGEVAVKVKTP